MHYKNGREAKAGDQVITKDYSGTVVTGVTFGMSNNGRDVCNCNVSTIIPGGVTQLTCQSTSQIWHAEDALAAAEAAWAAANPPAPVDAPLSTAT